MAEAQTPEPGPQGVETLETEHTAAPPESWPAPQSTVANIYNVIAPNMGRKVDDGQSVRVTCPMARTLAQGEFAVLDNFHGFNLTKPKVSTSTAEPVILQTDGATYETTQINTADAFATVGQVVYWDETNKRLTTTASTNRAVGKVVLPKDASGCIWMRLLPQPAT